MTQMALPQFQVHLAQTAQDLRDAQRLRYDVFVTELGGSGPLIDHDAKLERDHLDPYFDHLLLRDTLSQQVVGVYRLMRPENAAKAGAYYSASEYDLTQLQRSGRRILELGRSCVHPAYRGGLAMHMLWSGLARYVAEHEIEVLFGVASFHGTDIDALAQPLSLLHHRHLAPKNLRTKCLAKSFQRMDLIDESHLDRRSAMLQIPSLIKAYLRLGGCVGEGAYIDHEFNTVDVCLIMDTAQMNDRQTRKFGGAFL
ncbi:ornithine-acyl[acyl carrier protein] N-acyltransferase [Sulfitobacter brevis]|uniref:L-ornithine N(alpha)-acyltransferase n=1 Tax=Sulfitobacter brevis TaxID=74348 RepID=A0A1I2FYF2_9RHOB|nr:GNAT family N-acyltransferase [Sulfitobacter brevis]SFF10392.1 ornithine-acyl[acyl carrier protein] N-acyltransferase [Sulfitobacter brevis]